MSALFKTWLLLLLAVCYALPATAGVSIGKGLQSCDIVSAEEGEKKKKPKEGEPEPECD